MEGPQALKKLEEAYLESLKTGIQMDPHDRTRLSVLRRKTNTANTPQ